MSVLHNTFILSFKSIPFGCSVSPYSFSHSNEIVSYTYIERLNSFLAILAEYIHILCKSISAILYRIILVVGMVRRETIYERIIVLIPIRLSPSDINANVCIIIIFFWPKWSLRHFHPSKARPEESTEMNRRAYFPIN